MPAFFVGSLGFSDLPSEGEDRRRFVSSGFLGLPEDTFFCWRETGRKPISWLLLVRGRGINSDSVSEVPSVGDMGRFA